MPAITWDRFDGGLDVRQLSTSADANRLRVLQNAYVTTGRTIRKRPGLRKITELDPGSIGLFPGINSLWTFSLTDITHTSALELSNAKISDPTGTGLDSIVNVEVFNGYLYVVAKYRNGIYRHHYLDGSEDTVITDENCPHSASIVKKTSKIYAIKDDVVRYSATSNARDWTTAEDAGFLPVALQQSINNEPTALGEYQDKLVVFFEDSSQIWTVDTDPNNMSLSDTVPVGTRYQYSHANMGMDIFFLAPSGFRSMAVQAYSNNMMDNDIGSPIDSLVKVDMRQAIIPRMIYFRGVGQLMCFLGNYAYVYSYSRSSKISAWSIWRFPFNVDYVAEHEAVLYLRSGNAIYALDELQYTDDGTPIDVVAELPYLDCRRPGVLKQFTGVDIAAEGSMKLAFRFDPTHPELVTPPLTLSGDTRPLPRIPVEVCSTNLSIQFSNQTNEPFELAAVTIYHEILSGFAT